MSFSFEYCNPDALWNSQQSHSCKPSCWGILIKCHKQFVSRSLGKSPTNASRHVTHKCRYIVEENRGARCTVHGARCTGHGGREDTPNHNRLAMCNATWTRWLACQFINRAALSIAQAQLSTASNCNSLIWVWAINVVWVISSCALSRHSLSFKLFSNVSDLVDLRLVNGNYVAWQLTFNLHL